MKKNPYRKTPKGYYYDSKTNKRISKKEGIRREKISAGVKRYWKEKKEKEDVEKILKELEEEFEIIEEEKQVWYHD